MTVLPTEPLDSLLSSTVQSPEWQLAQSLFNKAKTLYIVGNGGNLAVADHAAVDITRLSDKLGVAPGSGILATSVIGDSSIDTWFTKWLEAHVSVMPQHMTEDCMAIGISSSGTASNISSFLTRANQLGISTTMISARKVPPSPDYNIVSLGTDFYHTGGTYSYVVLSINFWFW